MASTARMPPWRPRATKKHEEYIANLKEVAIAATADKEHIQAMSANVDELLAVVKKQQDHIKDLGKQNQDLIDIIKNVKTSNTQNKRPAPKNRNQDKNKDKDADKENKNQNAAKRPKFECGICGNRHPTEKCYELERNKDARPDWWTSIFESK